MHTAYCRIPLLYQNYFTPWEWHCAPNTPTQAIWSPSVYTKRNCQHQHSQRQDCLGTSLPSCQVWGIGSEESNPAGSFCLFGLSCGLCQHYPWIASSQIKEGHLARYLHASIQKHNFHSRHNEVKEVNHLYYESCKGDGARQLYKIIIQVYYGFSEGIRKEWVKLL